MSSRHIDVGGYSIQVFEQGEGPTLVFGHSLTFDSAMWQPVADELSDRFHLAVTRSVSDAWRGQWKSCRLAKGFYICPFL